MNGFHANIEKLTRSNTYFRRVLFTAKYSQLVVMCLKPGEEIGLEVHNNLDQFFRFEEGEGKVIVNAEEFDITADDAVIVPAGARHNVINTSTNDLKLYTLYSPPNHPDATVHKTKEEADKAEAQKHHKD